jgi:hypothetical protein
MLTWYFVFAQNGISSAHSSQELGWVAKSAGGSALNSWQSPSLV